MTKKVPHFDINIPQVDKDTDGYFCSICTLSVCAGIWKGVASGRSQTSQSVHDTQVEHQLEGTVWVPEHHLQGHAIVQLMAELPASASCSWHPKVIRR